MLYLLYCELRAYFYGLAKEIVIVDDDVDVLGIEHFEYMMM